MYFGFVADLYVSPDRYDLTSALRASSLSLDFAGQLRHTDTTLAVKADATYKMPDIGTHKVRTFLSPKVSIEGGLHSREVAYLLLIQQPRVRFSAFP